MRPAADEVEERLHVALLGPAHVARAEGRGRAPRSRGRSGPGRRSATGAGRAPSRTSRARSMSIGTLADDDDPAAVAREARGELERVGRARRGADEDRVEPDAAGLGLDRVLEPGVVARERARAATRWRAPTAAGSRSMPNAVAAGGLQQLDGELADEAEPDDADALADARRRPGARRAARWRRPSRTRRPRSRRRRDARDEVRRNGDDLARGSPSRHRRTRRGRRAATPWTPAPTSTTTPADE